MTMKEDEAKLGRAIAGGLECAPATPCLGHEEIAALADGSAADSQRDRLMMHLAECGQCRELFISTRELTDDAATVGQRRWFMVPSAFAAAAVLVIALTLTIEKTPEEKLQTAKKEEPAAPQAIAAQTGGGAAGDGVLAAKAQAPLPTADQAPSRLGKQAPAPTVARIASMLAQTADPRQLAALAGIRQNKIFGFADQSDGAALAFRIGMSSVDLEVALLADDGDRAQAQAVRLGALLQALAGDQKIAGLERLSQRLEQGEKPSSLAGGSDLIEQLIPRGQLGYARLGAWAEGARLAARSGNLAYFAGGVPDYFRKGALQSGVPQGAAVALRELEQKVKDPEKIDLGAVAECAEGLCQGF